MAGHKVPIYCHIRYSVDPASPAWTNIYTDHLNTLTLSTPSIFRDDVDKALGQFGIKWSNYRLFGISGLISHDMFHITNSENILVTPSDGKLLSSIKYPPLAVVGNYVDHNILSIHKDIPYEVQNSCLFISGSHHMHIGKHASLLN